MASSTTCLQLKDAVDVWIVCEVHKVLLSLLVYVLTNCDPVEIDTREVARQILHNLLARV